MGNFFSFFFLPLFRKDSRVLMIGLDAAGKTTILYKLKLGDIVSTCPTIGFNVETVQYKNLNMTVWDVGGQERIRALWKHYYSGVGAIIFVVDANDRERVAGGEDSAAAELRKLFFEDQLRGVPILVLANKMDLPNAMKVNEMASALGLSEIHERKWFVQPATAIVGEGLWEGLDWLARNVE